MGSLEGLAPLKTDLPLPLAKGKGTQGMGLIINKEEREVQNLKGLSLSPLTDEG